MSTTADALSAWSTADVVSKLLTALPRLSELQMAQLELQCITGAYLSNVTEAELNAKLPFLQPAQLAQLWSYVKQLQLYEEHLNQEAIVRLLQEEVQTAVHSEHQTPGSTPLEPATADALSAEIEGLAQRLADQRLAYTFVHDVSTAVAAAEAYQALQQLELQDANLARRLAGQHPLTPVACDAPQQNQAGRTPSTLHEQELMAAAAVWGTLTPDSASNDILKIGSSSSSSVIAGNLTLSSAHTSASSSSASGAQSSSVRLTKAMLQQAKGQLLVVQAAAFRSGNVCTLSGVFAKHISGDRKGKSPATPTPPAEMHAEQCCACFEHYLSPTTATSVQIKLPCGHSQCGPCLAAALRVALTDSTMLPLRCCGLEMETASLAQALLQDDECQLLLARMEEQLAVHKMFCPNSACSVFINLNTEQHRLGKTTCKACQTAICTSCKSSWHTGYTCAQFQALPEELRASQADLELLKLAEQQHWARCPQCRFYVELALGCYHMTCRCGFQFCYVCTTRWKECNCPQWDEGRLLLQARHQVDIQARAQNVRLDEDQFQQRLQHRVEELRDNHTCRHSWARRQPPLARVCEHCNRFPLNFYCYYCAECQLVACHVCRFHRVR